MPAEPMDEWELKMHRLHLRDAKERIERGETVDLLVLIKIGERALQEIQRLANERDHIKETFAQAILSEYAKRHKEWTEANGFEQKTPRTLFHQIIKEMIAADESKS